mgnify:CR=1 FL=1
MLTFPDWKQKQIVFIQTEREAKNQLFFRNENLVYEKDGVIINQASCHRIVAVFIIGDFTFTSSLVKECRKRAVSLFLLGLNFSVYGSIVSKAEGNYLLRNLQYNTPTEREFIFAKLLIKNKIQNQFRLMCSLDRDLSEGEYVKLLDSVNLAKDYEALLGLEGNFSRIFFNQYFAEIDWSRRMPRVKPDIPNFLLDLGYTFLFNIIDALLSLFGFDTYKGVYHKLFFQRKSLTCDLVEPFRCIIDRQLLKSYHLKQISEKDFKFIGGRYTLSYDKSQKYSKIFMEAIMDEKESLYIFVQQFYRAFMNGRDAFPAFNISNKKVE